MSMMSGSLDCRRKSNKTRQYNNQKKGDIKINWSTKRYKENENLIKIYYIYTFQDGSFVSLQHKFEPDFIPTYAVIDKKPPPSPSSLKNGRTSGTFPKKHVTMVTNPDYRAKDRTIPMEYHVIKPSPPPYGYPSLQYNTQNGYANYDYPKSTQTGYPLQPSQPTPYSTLTQNDQPIKSYQGQMSTGFNVPYNEDYDNTYDTTPMVSYVSHGSSGQTWRSMSRDDNIPEPQPLVYPSERRPMTFQQTSSSKMSIYDNVQFGLDKIGNEWCMCEGTAWNIANIILSRK